MKIGEADPNLDVPSGLNIEGLEYYDLQQKPFAIYGLYQNDASGRYMRFPAEKAEKVSPGVRELNLCTAGARVRFCTDSPYVAVKAELTSGEIMPHMPVTGSHGMDLYVCENGQDVFRGAFVPPATSPHSYEGVVFFYSSIDREITIHLPLYSGVKSLLIGVDRNARIKEGRKYRPVKPVVYYGSSITQGGCVSRPGNHYPAAIARETNADFICLGFSGGAKGEKEMADYLAGLKASVFVCDYDHNAPSVQHLQDTLWPVYEIYREKNPDVPVIFISRPNIRFGNREELARRDIIYRTYSRAMEAGDENVYFIDGFQLFSGPRRYDCTVDGVHPNDAGFFRMAEVIGEVVRHCLPEDSMI